MAHGLPVPPGFPNATDSGLPPDIVSLTQLEDLVRDQSRTFLYSALAMFTLLFYDYLITLNMEAKYIWASKDRFSVTNFLFVLNRYFPILRAFGFVLFSLRPPHDDTECSNWTDVNSWSTMVNVGIVEILMLLRTYALWGKSRLIGFILLSVFIAAVTSCIITVRSNLQPIRGVIPLAPMAVLPCDRPSPFKYMLVYCSALVVEVTSLSFMMGRIMYLTIKSKSQSRSRPAAAASIRNRSLALPLIRGLQWHGTSYFVAVIFVMTFTIISSFSTRLARAVVNAGVAPTITSIACNRVIFALRGLYMEVTDGEGENRTGQHPHSLSHNMHSISQGGARRVNVSQQKHLGTNYEYDDEVAITRHDVDTKDLSVSTDTALQYRDRDPRARSVEDDLEASPMPQGRRVFFPGARPVGLVAPFHTHGASSSTAMTSTDSLALGRSSLADEDGLQDTPTTDNYRHVRGREIGHAFRGTSKSSIKFAAGPASPSSSQFAPGGAGSSIMSRTPTMVGSPIINPRPGHTAGVGHAKRSLSSLSGVIRSSTREEGTSGGEMVEDMSTSRPTQGLVEKLGSIWRRRDGKEGSPRSYHESSGPSGEERVRAREREKDRHPLDHHYEMDTIHSEFMPEQQWSLGELEVPEDEDPEEDHQVAKNANATRTGVRESASWDGDPPDGTLYTSRTLDQGFHHQSR